MKSTRFKPWMCAACGYAMDAASPVGGDDAVPHEGDASLCINCGAAYVLHLGAWCAMTDAEWAALDPECRATIATSRRVIERQGWNLARTGGRA